MASSTTSKDREQQRLADLDADVRGDSLLKTVPLAGYGAHEMTGRSYAVGNIMFSAFYDLVGETDFNKTIGGYHQQFPTVARQATSSRLRKRAPRDVSKFFDDWIFSPRWTDEIASSKSVSEIVARYR